MMKINNIYQIYKIGFLIILALPILTLPPWFFPPDFGKTIIFRSIISLLLFFLACNFLYKKIELNRLNLKKNYIAWTFALFFATFLLATIFSVDPYFSLWGSPYRGGGFITFAFYFIFAILCFVLLKKEEWKKVWIFSISIGILVSFVAIFQYYGLFDRIFVSFSSQPPSTLGNPILLAIYLLLLFFLTLSFAINEKSKYLKRFYIFSLVVFGFAILIAASRAVYFGIIIGLLFFFLPQIYEKIRQIRYISKKSAILKILAVFFLIIIVGAAILEKSRTLQILQDRLSIKDILANERFLEWKTALKVIEDRPVLGWGPENFSVGFDKNYDPMVTRSPWWDRAHNMFLDIGSQAGLLGLAVYILLFIALFWKIHEAKRKTEHENTRIILTGLQATLIGYLVANFFSFDAFPTYLVFFLIVGYTLHLTSSNSAEIMQIATQNNAEISINQRVNQRQMSGLKISVLIVLSIVLIVFLYQYNLLPFYINAQINKASNFVDGKNCHQAFVLMEKILPKSTFLDSYARMEYASFVKSCSDYYPENSLVFLKQGAALINEAIKIQPLYTRYWLFLADAMTILATKEKDAITKNNLLQQANHYLDQASKLAQKHQEIIIGRAKIAMAAGDYKAAENYSENCIELNPNLGDCYWYRAIAKIYLNNVSQAKKDIQTAQDKAWEMNSKTSLLQLSDAYGSLQKWQDLVPIYERLIAMDSSVVQYHSSLAFFYRELGQYDKAREQAMTVLQLSPESKENVDAFLQTLPLK